MIGLFPLRLSRRLISPRSAQVDEVFLPLLPTGRGYLKAPLHERTAVPVNPTSLFSLDDRGDVFVVSGLAAPGPFFFPLNLKVLVHQLCCLDGGGPVATSSPPDPDEVDVVFLKVCGFPPVIAKGGGVSPHSSFSIVFPSGKRAYL